MVLTKEQKEGFEKAARPLMEYLGKNHHPHVTVILDYSRAEILETSATLVTDDYVPD